MRVSNSSIQCFKSCRRMYELKYIYGLEPVEQSPAVERGTSYHEAVEKVLTGQQPDCDNPKIAAMVEVFSGWNRPEIEAVEKWIEYPTASGHTVVGRIDAKAKNGAVIEHKTTSGLITGAYFQKLEIDEQIPTYMIAENTNRVIYTVCATPTIRQKKNESNDEFKARCLDWFDSAEKFAVTEIFKTDEQLKQFAVEQDAIINEMENCKLFYRNPNHCTKWGRLCEYAPVCMQYDPAKEYIQFTRRDR